MALPCLAAYQTTSAKDLTYIADPQLPPDTYQESGTLKGIHVDMLEKICERIGIDLNSSNIKIMPWTEAYQRGLKENNTVLLAVGRIPERERLFEWVGPVTSDKFVLFAKSNSNISIKAPEELKKYKIGAVEDNAATLLLLGQGLKKEDLVLETTPVPIIEMLKNGTIDAWAYSEMNGIWSLNQSGTNISDYKAIYTLAHSDGYYAFNNHTSDSIVQSFQQALDYLKSNRDATGVSDYERILSKYIPFAYIANTNKQDEVKAFLDEAITYLKANGQEMAIQEFNNRSGAFVRGDLYVFGYDLNGTCIVHPINASLIGLKGLSDSNGVDIVDREIALAKRGGGTLYIVFPNPAHGGKKEVKQLYIKTANNSYFGSGLYLSNISASFDQKQRDDLVGYVNEALQFAKENGEQKSLAVFNDPKGNFTRDGRYIFAYDYDGTTLALPYQPELIGTSRLDALDPNGVDFIQQIIDVAKNGSGFMYYVYPDPSRNMTQTLKLSYVTNVDGTWFLGSGIYAQS
jgi:ABC-type amino acid transport substrate-binding protein